MTRGRVRLPRDLAVREPYVPPENEPLADKFDRVLGITTAEADGWRVVGGKRSSVSDNKPKKSTLSVAAANAALDSVLPRAPEPRPSNGVPPEPAKLRYVPPVSDADLEEEEEEEDEAPVVQGHDDFDDGELDEEDDDVEPSDEEEVSEDDEPAEEDAPKVKGQSLPKPEPKPKNIKGEDLEDDEDDEEDERVDESDEAEASVPADEPADEPAATPRPARRPRKNAGRGMGKVAQKPKIVASVNPLFDEATSAAATELAPHPGQDGGEELLDDEDRQAIDDFTAAARSPATVATFRADLRQFSDWCAMKGIRSFPAEPRIVAAWASHLAKNKGLKYAQIERRIAAISAAHAALEHPSPCQDSTVKNVMLGIKSRPDADQDGSTAITRDNLASIMTDAPKTKRWRRNKAMLLLGFSAGLRRAELVEIRLEGLRFDADGLLLAIPNRFTSKMETVRVPKINGRLCTVAAVARWINSSGITSGYLFRSTHDGGVVDSDPEKHLPAKRVTKIVKEAIKLIGLDPRRYDAKSLRAGYSEAVQAATQRTIKDVDYMRQAMRPQAL